MKNFLVLLVVLVAMGTGGFLLYQKLFPPEEEVIRGRLHELAEAASLRPSDKPLSQLGNTSAVLKFFTEDIKLNVNADSGRRLTLEGRDRLQQLLMGAAQFGTTIQVTFNDIQVIRIEKRSATVELTALAKISTEPNPIAQILELSLVKRDGEWRVHEVSTKDALRKLR